MAGKPLIAWTIEAAKAAKSVSRVVVSTEDEQIADIARDLGAEVPFLRPSSLATDNATSVDVVLHAIEALLLAPDDRILLLQPTSPLRTADDIDEAQHLFERNNAGAVVSVSPVSHALKWLHTMDGIGRLEKAEIEISGDVYGLNGAIYLCSVKAVRRERSLMPRALTYGYVMPAERSIDIDVEWELQLAEKILEGRR